jgi:hypothetical protein
MWSCRYHSPMTVTSPRRMPMSSPRKWACVDREIDAMLCNNVVGIHDRRRRPQAGWSGLLRVVPGRVRRKTSDWPGNRRRLHSTGEILVQRAGSAKLLALRAGRLKLCDQGTAMLRISKLTDYGTMVLACGIATSTQRDRDLPSARVSVARVAVLKLHRAGSSPGTQRLAACAWRPASVMRRSSTRSGADHRSAATTAPATQSTAPAAATRGTPRCRSRRTARPAERRGRRRGAGLTAVSARCRPDTPAPRIAMSTQQHDLDASSQSTLRDGHRSDTGGRGRHPPHLAQKEPQSARLAAHHTG